MTTIVTRSGKGSPLTHTEVDTNFTNLNTAKLETAAIPLGTLGAPSISFLNFSTTGIYSPAGNELGVSMLGSDKIRIKSSGEIIINATASRTTLGITPRLQIEGSASSSQCSLSLTGAGAGSSLIPRLYLSKARSSVNAVVLEDDILGLILFNGGDGSSLVNAGFIKAEVDGTPSSGIVPGRLVFATVDTAGSTAERMIIKNNGNVSIDGTTFHVDAVNNRVGIGNSSPSKKLEVAGDILMTGSDGFGIVLAANAGSCFLSRDGTLTSNVQFGGATSNIDIGSGGGFQITLSKSACLFNSFPDTANVGQAITLQERMRIDTSGRLLVGTSNSRSNFNNAGGNDPLFQIERAGGAGSLASIVRNENDAFGPVLEIGKSRGAAVGSYAVVSNDGVGDNLGRIYFNGSDGTDMVPGAAIEAFVDGAPGANDMPGRLVFSTTADGASSPTERLRLASNGRATFDLNNAGLYLLGLGTGAGTNALRWSTSTGLVTADTSSRLVKENIVDCPYGIDTVKALQPRKYFRTDDQRSEIGFVADEMTLIIPELVPYGPKSVITNNPDDTENIPIGVNYEKLTAVLTKALQEAMERIEQLETSNTDLLARVIALEAN